ncbi:MAG: Maf family protein [Oscillospiraceae bacterium]
MNPQPIILASESPRRRELFSLITDNFLCVRSPADESGTAGEPASELSLLLARRKCLAAAALYPNRVVVGCDTVVEARGETLGKPRDRVDAIRMLSLLSGTVHSVYTGVCIARGAELASFVCRSYVRFIDIPGDELEAYADTDEPYDKAGAYGIQGRAARFVDSITGDYFNIMGLPISMLWRELRALNAL